MGTRNLTMVIQNGKPAVAQYGQWDGYPSGQGATILAFLLTCDLNKFRNVMERCRFIESSKRKEKELEKFFKDLGCPDGFMTTAQAEKYHEKYPFLTRDNGGAILQLLYNDETNNKLWIHDSSNFASDSLFCEWGYVIDLDNNTFEVYKGFVQTPLEKTERFYYLQEKNEHVVERRGDDQYYPIKHVKTYQLNDLPGVDDFIKEVEEIAYPKEEEESVENK